MLHRYMCIVCWCMVHGYDDDDDDDDDGDDDDDEHRRQ